MGCARCGQQRQKVAAAAKSGDVKKTVVETARGIGMMTGIIPKDRMPGPGNRKK